MEENQMAEGAKTFTEQEVLEIVDRMKRDLNAKMNECNKVISELNSTLNRLNFLLKIVSIKDVFSEEFIAKCAAEIEHIMTVPDEEEPKEEK